MAQEDNLHKLYINLTDDGYNLGTEDEFRKQLQNKATAEKFHQNMVDDGYQLGSFDEFVSMNGLSYQMPQSQLPADQVERRVHTARVPQPGERIEATHVDKDGNVLQTDTTQLVRGKVATVEIGTPQFTPPSSHEGEELARRNGYYNTKESLDDSFSYRPNEYGEMRYGWQRGQRIKQLNRTGLEFMNRTGAYDENYDQAASQAEKMSDAQLVAEFNKLSGQIADAEALAGTADGYAMATVLRAYSHELRARDIGFAHGSENKKGIGQYQAAMQDPEVREEILKQENMSPEQRKAYLANAYKHIMAGESGQPDVVMLAGTMIHAKDRGMFPEEAYNQVVGIINNEHAEDVLAGAMQSADAEIARLEQLIEQRTQQLFAQDEAEGMSLAKVMQHAESGSGAPIFNQRLLNDPELSMLWTAKRAAERRKKVIERKQDNHGFMRQFIGTFWDTATDINTWDFGIQDMRDAVNLASFSGNESLSVPMERAREAMLQNTVDAQEAEQRWKLSAAQRWGVIGGQALPFVAEFIGTGGGFSGLRQGVTKGVTSFLERSLGKAASNKAAQWLVRSTGMLTGDIASALLMANTTGSLKTYSDILDRKTGDLMQLYDGTFVYRNSTTMGDAILKGEVANTLEYYTEMLGNHLDGLISGAGKRLGLSRLSEGMKWLTGRQIQQLTTNVLRQGGINELPSEILEEEANLILNAMLVGDNNFDTGPLKELANKFGCNFEVDPNSEDYQRSIFNPETQADIWGGMLFSIGAMRAPSVAIGTVGQGWNAANYYYYKHKTDLAGTKLNGLVGGDELLDRINNTTNEQIPSLVAGILADDDFTPDMKSLAMDYIGNLVKERGYNVRMFDNAKDLDPEQDQEEGETVDLSYQEGYNAADEEQAGVKERVDVARAWLYNLGFDDSNIESLSGELPEAWLAALSDEQREAVEEYTNAMAAYEGMLQHVQDDMEGAIAESEAAVDAQTHIETGAVHHAVLKTGGEVWVVGGNVALTPEGNIDIENSDGDLIVLDPATGGKRMIHISDLASADEPVMADQLKEEAATTIQETMATDASNRIDGVLSFQPGDEYTLPFGEEQHTITIIGDAGDGVNTVVSVDGGEQQLMPMQMIQEAADAQREARIAEQAAMEAAASQQQPVEQEPEATEEVTEEPVEEEQPDEDAMPMNGDEVDWFATSPERGHRFLYDEAGLSPEEADAVVANSVKDAEKELEKVSKKAPKPGNAAQLNKYRAEKAAHEQQVAAAQAAVDYWKGVQATQEAIRQQAEAELLAQRAEESKQRSEAAAQTEAEKEAQRLADREAARQEREALNGVPDVVNDKPEDARARGFRNVNGERVDRQLLTNSVGGRTGSVKFSTDVTVPSRIAVIEADELQPSHIEGQRNPLFFLDEAQPKNRTDQASDVAAEKIAKNINPEEITGDGGAYQFSAPTVNERGEVVQGNNRSSALKRMWSSGAYADSQQRYKQYLIDHAEEFGLNPQLVASMNRPVMVNEISVDDAEAIRLGQMSAKDLESGGIERIDPVTTARKLGPKMRNFASVLLSGEDENMSLAELIAANGEAAVKWLADRGVISPTQVQSAWNPAKTGLTAEAKLDLQNILRQQLFQGGVSDLPHMFEAMPAKAQKAILSTFMRDMDSADADRILPELQHAIEAWYGAASGTSDFSKATNYEAASRAMLGWANVRNAFSGVLPSEKFSKFAIELANRLQGSSMRNMVTYFNEFYDLVQGTGVGDLFGSGVSGEKLTLAEAIAKIFNVDINETNNGQERSEDVGSDRGDGQEGRQGEPGDAAGTEPATPGAGTPERGGRAESNDQSVAQAEAEVDTEPTDGQKEAGNYKKGHVKIDGFDVTIEQPKGSVRSGVDASGKPWSQEMHNTYGYIRGTEGVDGDHIDVFLSDHLDNWNGMVYVVDQVNKDGSFDEHKVMYGFDSEQEARDAYLSNYEEGWTGLGNITGVTRDEFKKWVDSSHRKTKPFAEYKSVKVSRPIQGLEGYTEDEILADVRAFIEQQLEDAGIEGVTIKGMALHGSRMRGDARPDSDLDVVVEYEGDISEDAFFNLVNYDLNFRGPNGVIIDINPITRGKSGTLEQYMERSRRYDEEKRAAAAEATEPVQSTGTGDQAYTITPTKYTTKKNKELDVWLVKFSGEIDKKQATEIAKETRGWWDREQGGFLMRSEEAARDLAERVAGATSQSDAIPEPSVESKQAQASASENASKAASEEPQQSGGTGNLTIAEVKDRIKFSDKEEERLFDEVADALTHDGLPISEAPVEVMLNSQEEIEERIRERVGDYIAAHYPTQATVSALTNSPDGLREREAMAKDADFAALRDEVEAEVASFNERFSQKLAELRSVLGKPDVTADEVASCWKDAVEFEHLRSENPENRSKTEPKREEITENRSKTEKKRSSAPKSGDRRIDDFGEKIGGARKDLARGRIRDAKKMSVKDLTTLKKGADDILSQANILRLYKDGQMDESTARHFMALNNVCKLAIKNKRPVIRDIVLGKYRDAAVAWEEGKPVTFDVTDKDLQAYRQMFPHSSEEKARESLVWQITDPLNMFMWTYESMNYPAEVRKMGQYVIVDYSKMLSPHVTLSRHIWVKNGYNAHRGYPFAKMEDAVEKMKKLCPVVQEKEKKSRGEKAEHGLRVVNEGYGYYVKSRNIPGNIYLSGKFNSEKQAQAYLDENLDRLREREQRLVDALMGSNIGMAEREGVDYRDGKDVTPQDFLDEFGFRGVEFGNWVPQGERQMYLNKTYDAIKDFCAIVGISPKAFSLGGRLGLAFGARGHSKAMAHYEPAKEVINLTRMSGVGSLAHEWFHAVDNYLAKQKTGNMSDMATVTHDVVRDELSHVFKELYDVMKSMDYHHRSRRAGEYWGRTEEEFARLFENYIYNKLASREATSPVLVRKDVLLEEVEEDMKARWPYPSLEENEKMEPYFDKLFDTIREKTDDNGHVVLFQKVEGSTISKDAAEREAALRDGLVELLRGAGIEVVTDAEEGQRVLDGARRAADALDEMKKRNQQQETALPEDESSFKGTAISSADGAKVIQNLENLSKESEKLSTARIRTFLGDVADAIGATQYGSSSRYATFETVSGEVVTIRLADHNAHTSGFDNSGRDNGISIVISRKPNAGINNDGEAHLVEFFYSDKQLRKAEGSPYSDIVRSIQQALYSGEYKDTTGLAQRQEVNEDVMREHRVFHGSGAEFDAFDHSHMGEGEGAQAYGWGTYVTEVEDIGRRYAETAGGVRYKGHDVDELYEHSIDGMEDSERNAAWMLSRAMRTFGFSDAVERLRSLYKQDLEKSNRLKGLSIEQTMERYGCSRADAKRYIKDAAAKADMWQQRLDALEGMREEDFTAPSRVLYEVEIPEEAGAVYLDHVALMKDQPDVLESVDNALTAQGWRRQEIDDTPVFTKGEKKIILSDGLSGGELYLVLEGGLGSDRAASEFLHEAGVTGIVYPSNYLGGGNRMGSKNYVIFNEADAQITGREKFFRTADGTAYGFVKDGRIYIDPRIATSETPVHEYTHLWCAALRRVNPAAWARLKEALLGQKDVLEHVKKLYPELEGDELMDEVFAHYSGRRGRERLQREQEREVAKAKGIFDKARVIAVFDRIRRALDNFWLAARHLFAGKTEGLEKLSAEDFADMAMADLLRGFNPTEEVRKLDADGRKAAQLRLVTDANAMTDTYHTGIRRIDDIKTYEEAVDEGEGIGSYPDFTEDDARAALERGRATVYSSHPIEPGSFVSMSRMEAEEYAGGGEVYSQEVPLEDVAWIYANEGQYAPVGDGGKTAQYTDNAEARLREALVEGGRLAIMERDGKWRIEGMPGEFGSRNAAIDEWRERAAGNVVWYLSEDGDYIEVEGNGDMYEMVSRTTTTSGRKRRERLARQQATRSANGRRMVDELADKLGVKVRYVEDMSEQERAQFSERQLRSKGWYNPRTGEVFINLGRHTRLYDILSTFLHETVAHKGLRRLFGKDFDTFLDNVYNNVNKGIRAEINRMAEVQKSRATEAQRARHDDEHWRRVATEEYMAKLAERLDLNHPEQRTIWEKIKGFLLDKLRKIGVTVADSLSDNDLRGILWESYHSMESEGVMGYAKGVAFRDQMEREAVNAGRAAAHETTQIAAEPQTQYTGSLFDVLPQAGAWAHMMSNMSERELRNEIAQDGPNVTSSYSEEYDRRHIQEYNQACDEIQAQLDRDMPGEDRLLELLQDAEAQWADGAYKDERRTGVLAAIDTLSRALDEERAELPSVEDDSMYRDDDIDWDAQASKEELAEHLRNIPDRVGIKPSGITTTISNDSDLEAMRGVVEDALYKDIVKNYNNPKVFGGYDPESGMIIVFTNKVGTRKEAESTWWHEKGHLVYDALSLKDKEECGRAAMDWLHKIGYLTDDQYNHYSDTSKGTEGAAWLTKYLFDYFWTDGILYGNFTGNGKIAKLAAAIQNYLKNGEEKDNDRLRQPTDDQRTSEGRSQAFGSGTPESRGRLNQEIGDTDDVDVAGFDAGRLTFEERITAGMLKAAADNRAAIAARTAAMRELGGNLSKLRQAMARQREYDRGTVDSIVRLARSVMESGFFRAFSPYEVKRLMSLINHAAGREDITKQAGKVVDLLLKHQLLSCENLLHEQMRTRGSKLNSQGVEVQAGLDIEGQRMVGAMRHALNLDADALQERINNTLDRMFSPDQALADVAAAEYQGLLLAQQYIEEIKGSKQEENELRQEQKNAKEDLQAGTITREQYNQFLAETENAIRENRLERVAAYDRLTTALGAGLGASVQRAKEWREMQKERVNEIRHNANSDLEGIPADEHVKPGWMQRAANWSLVRFFMKPLATFDYMLRMLGSKNVNGEGYLWQRFMCGWTEATEREWRNLRAAHKALDEKASEVFGKKMRWSDLFSIERKMPGMDVSFWDAGEEKIHHLTQGNLLYIYMVNKMSDGRMKLRKMGINEEDVEAIRQMLDPRFIELADWLQEEFLVNKRNDYNAVYQRMFGASMAAIEHYFPLKINSRSRGQEEDLSSETYLDDNNMGSTITGSIIKRKRNSLPLDVTGADAFDVVLGHLQDMEHWAAFAEFNRDLNTLLSYKRFRNRLLNMSSVRFGSGKTLWMNFKRTCAIASGAYRPKVDRDSVDTSLVNVAKGVTAAKISFRIYTALKQLLSYPAYLSEASGLELIKSSNPIGAVKAWNWAIDELPGFAQRWQSRQAGDSRLRESDADWGLWRNKIVETAGRWGMSPNAFIDGLTVAMGAKAIYETKLKRYRKAGYPDEQAKRRALRDASISYNETQQSNANAYLSAMQLDRSATSVALTVFRNASMGYQRRMFQAMANLKHVLFTPGYKAQALEFMTKQMVRDGLSEQQAQQSAERVYRRATYKNLADFAIFGWVMQMAWNLGPYIPYLLMGDDDDDKKEMLEDAALHAIAGGVEGLSGGNVMSDTYNAFRSGEVSSYVNTELLPLMSDIESLKRKLGQDMVEGAHDLVNLAVQAGVGVNPQQITDVVAAVLDVADGDPKIAHEAGFVILRVLSVPQSQLDKLYIDELGLIARDARKLNAGQMAEGYARYKMRRGSAYTSWAYSDEDKRKAEERYLKRFETKVKERIAELDDEQLEDNFNTDDDLRRKWVGQAVAKRAGGTDSYGSPDTDYGMVYERKRDYTDLAQDILLQVEKKKAKEAGDNDRYKALDRAQSELTNIKKGKHTTKVDEPGLGEGFDDEVMTRLRERRKELLSELGIM